MLMRTHSQGWMTPPPIAIAYHLIRAWVEDAVPAGFALRAREAENLTA